MLPFIDKKKNQQAFSVIELIVSASIIAIMSVLVMANFRGSNQKTTLGNEAERLAAVIRETHINSLIGLTVNGARPAGGFGLHLQKCTSGCSYILFADQDQDHLYDGGVNDSLVQQIGLLGANVYIDNIVPDNTLDITFVPPYGTIYFNGSDSVDQATITLGYGQTDYKKNITLSRLTGRVEIE